MGGTAIPRSLTHASRQSKGKKGSVWHLFYYVAFVLPEGASVMGTFGESPNNDVGICLSFSLTYSPRFLCLAKLNFLFYIYPAGRSLPHQERSKNSLQRSPARRGSLVGVALDPSVFLGTDYTHDSRGL